MTLVLFIDFQWNRTFLFWFGLFDCFFLGGGGGGGGRGKGVFIWPYLLLSYKRTNCHISRHWAVILLQIVMVSPGTHHVWNHESQSRSNEFQLKKGMSPKLKMLGPLCNQTVNLKTDSKSLNYSALKLKFSPSILKHNKGEKKYESLNKSHNNFHRNYTNDLTHVMNYCSSLGIFMHQGRRTQRQQNHMVVVVGRVHSSKPWHRARVSILKSCNPRQN